MTKTDNDKHDDNGDDDNDVVYTAHACSLSVTTPRISINIVYSLHDSAVVVTKLLSNNNIIITDTVLALFIVPN